jgi:putative zinc finger/helix-turn-helix YgiT family protein
MGSTIATEDSVIGCPSCGSDHVITDYVDDSFEYGEGAKAVCLTARIPLRRCQACSFAFIDEAGEIARHEAVCRHLEIMPPREIVEVRNSYGLSQEEFARVARIGRASLARWESGALYQNASSDALLYLLRFPENLERLRCRTGEFEGVRKFRRGSFRALSLDQTARAQREAQEFQLYARH